MKKFPVLLGLAVALRSALGDAAPVPANPFGLGLDEIVTVPLAVSAMSPTRSLARLPLSFVRNDGQSDSRTKFEVHGPGYLLLLGQTEIEMVLPSTLTEDTESPGVRRSCAAFEISGHSPKAPEARRTPKRDEDARPDWKSLQLKLVGAQTNAAITGEEELPGKFNYFLGNDPALWRTNLPSFTKVRYHNIYPGIDLVFYGSEGQLEYDFVLAPGADPNQIQIAIEGAERVKVDWEGSLQLAVSDQELRWRQPTIYQEKNGHLVHVEGEYVLRPAVAGSSTSMVREVGFHIASYDRTLALVVDPVLVYGTFLGASDGATYGTSIATGPGGCVYVAGRTTSSSFPTKGALMPTNSGGGWNFYLTKLDATGQMVYSTYIGPIGTSPQLPKIAVDQTGSVYMAGNSSSRTFPVVNAVQPVFGGGSQEGDAFVMKLVPDGSALVYSTYLGGSGDDYASGIAVGKEGAASVTGSTTSFNFPRTNAVQTTYRGSGDAFVAKLNPAGTALVYSTYFGGSGGDSSYSVAVDSEGNTLIAGQTTSTNLPIRSPFQERFGGGYGDGFWAKLSPGGDTIVSASYFGGTLNEWIRGIAVGSDGDIYLTGKTYSDDFPIAKAFQPQKYAAGGPFPFDSQTGTAFVARYSTASNSLVFSTYLGGSVTDEAVSVALDERDNVYVSGVTLSPDFPTSDSALQGWNNGGSALYGVGFESFFSVLTSDGSKLIYSSYLGGTGNDYEPYVAVDHGGSVYLTGSTTSADFPITQPLIPYAEPTSAYVVKFTPLFTVPPSLQIMRSGRQVLISWPTNSTGFGLEASGTLFPAANWASEPTPPAVVGDQNVITLELGPGTKFFRLNRP